ncbi:hypothetical protein M3Y99_01998700 [Aphelenchoides fujianensis]|nr:hypothetical protein M3Y99_01998700 [Aphelenchoides fujianensis]
MSAPSSSGIRLCEDARRSLLYKALDAKFDEGCECDPEDLCECLHRRTLRFLLVSKDFLSAFFSGVKREDREKVDWPTITLSSRITLESARWKHVGELELTAGHLPEGSAFSVARLLRVAALESIRVQVGSLDEEDPEMDLASEHHDDRMGVLLALKNHATLQKISLSTGGDEDDDEEVNELLAEMPDKVVRFYSSSFDQCALFKDRKTVMDEVEICGHEQPESSAIVATFQVPCRRFEIPFSALLELEENWPADEWTADGPLGYREAFEWLRSLNDEFTITIENVEIFFLCDAETEDDVKGTMEVMHTRSVQVVDCALAAGVRFHQLINVLCFGCNAEGRDWKQKQVVAFLEAEQTEVVDCTLLTNREMAVVRQPEHRGAKILWGVVAGR